MNILSSGKIAIAIFVSESLMPTISGQCAPSKINIYRAFRTFLEERGANARLADEHAEKWGSQLLQRVFDEIDEWESLGLPSPFQMHNASQSLPTSKHKSYREISGCDPLPDQFAEIYDWIGNQSEREFLFVCACFLKLAVAEKIFITDASGDGGIDLIGKLENGPLRSCYFFVQSKTSCDWISRESVLLEYGKFRATVSAKNRFEYLSALEIDRSFDGGACLYLFVSSSEFKASARGVACDLGILLRSKRQLAFWLACETTLHKLTQARDAIGGELSRDLSNNLSTDLSCLINSSALVR